jgi:hypothetical protein
MAIDAAVKKKLMPTAALSKLIDLRDKLADARANHRANMTVADESEEPAFSLMLSPAECTAVIELIEMLNDPKAIAKRYWQRVSFPTTQPWEKIGAARAISRKVAKGEKPTKALFEQIGKQYDLSEDQAEHAFRDFGLRAAALSKRNSKSQSGK